MKKIFAIIAAISLTFALSACEAEPRVGEGNSSNNNSSSAVTSETGDTKMNIDQFAKPQAGDTVATISIEDFGDIKLRFFPEITPKAVENFLTHAKNGYYNGLPFHRVMKDFMIQGGDPKGNGTGGESIWKSGFKVELSGKLHHYTGAISMARSQALDSQGSQFFIVQNTDIKAKTSAEWSQFESTAKTTAKQNGTTAATFPQDVREVYNTKGGSPFLDGSYTVFGQVYEGLEVLNKVAATPVTASSTGEKSVPIKKPIIKKITVEEVK